MRAYSYNNEIKNAQKQFLDVFNGIIIKRGDTNVRVRSVFGQRSRLFKQLEAPEKIGLVLPVLGVSRQGWSVDPSRRASINDYLHRIPDITSVSDYEYMYNSYPGIPITINFKVDIVAKYQDDLEQIESNFSVFFNPSIYVVIPHPKISGLNVKHKVIWSGVMEEDLGEDLDKAVAIPFKASTEFVFETWIFPGSTQIGTISDGIIERINFYPEVCGGSDTSGTYYLSNFYPVGRSYSFSEYEAMILSGLIQLPEFDRFTMSGIPFVFEDGTSSLVVSGYWQEMSGMISGVNLYDYVPLSADPVLLITEAGELLVFCEASILTDSNESIDLSSLIYNLETSGHP